MNTPTLAVTDLSRRFGSGPTEVLAVRNVSLAVAPGEVVLIMGPSGSGKTTLLLMLGALLRPSGGEIRLDGEVLTNRPERELPAIRLRRFGFIFQDFNLLSALSAIENVALVGVMGGMSSKEAKARATDLLTQFGLLERLRFRPELLSGGEKQRVAIARALVNDPTFILADEPTANLDAKNGRELMRLLRSIAKEQGRSIVIVSHDERIRDIADRVLWLEDGSLKEMTALSVDPVCAMRVEQEKALISIWDGEPFTFCSKGCRDEFLQAPYRFFPDTAAGGRHAAALRDAVRMETAVGAV